ncbi:sugar transferase [Rhodococcus sp. NPDC047139]|uniref:sugar transferase n=1 Tax=Rhodococcus sp. NPDC047139 TaxID=3155141 RepID=UPI0033DEA465
MILCDLFALVFAHVIVTLGYHSLDEIDSWRTPVVIVAALVAALLSMGVQKVWDERVLGYGTEEFRRVIRAYVFAVAALAVAGYGWGTAAGQSWTFGSLLIALVLTLLGRRILRSRLSRARARGRCLHPVLVTGDVEEVRELVSRAECLRQAGWRIDGICLAAGDASASLPVAVDGVPVLGTDRAVLAVAEQHGFEAVALLPSGRWPHARTRKLSWELERIGADLLIAPVLMDIVGPRLHIAPLSGLPLLQMSAPCYSGPAWIVKNVFDRVVAVLILVVLAPVLLALALGIKADSSGPVLFRQRRVGRGGAPFTMYKFRSMVVGAEGCREEIAGEDIGAGVLFKVREDPRVTRVGRFIRRHSLDELPQLLNVVKGDMSLVGPRPPLESEVVRYGEDGAARRLFVKPGLTGLWQVSGRSDLSWDESVRADLRYVENWTFLLDLSILRRTVRAVLSGDGAY